MSTFVISLSTQQGVTRMTSLLPPLTPHLSFLLTCTLTKDHAYGHLNIPPVLSQPCRRVVRIKLQMTRPPRQFVLQVNQVV
jgi:hypothetical protein